MIIGLSGYAQVGKDTVANHLVENYGFVKVSFADPIREALYRLDPRIRIDEFNGASLASAVDHMGWEEVKRLSSDARELLQRLGTEVGREMFGDDFWVNQGLIRAKEHKNVVFADTRYRNEANAIVRSGGQIWRINKPGSKPVNNHTSEVDLDYYNFDWVIPNYVGVKEMLEVVDKIMETRQSLV
jgi:dephospho-CoA kinase